MPLDRWQGVRRELLQRLVIASLGIFVEQVRGFFVRLDLLLDVELVELLGLRLGQCLEHALLLLVELGRQLHIELLGLDDALQFLGRLAMRLDHMLAERLDRLGLSFLARELARGHLVQVARRGLLDEHRRAGHAARNEGQRRHGGERGHERDCAWLLLRVSGWRRAAAVAAPSRVKANTRKQVPGASKRRTRLELSGPDRPCGLPRRGTTRAVRPGRSTPRSGSWWPRRSPRRKAHAPRAGWRSAPGCRT